MYCSNQMSENTCVQSRLPTCLEKYPVPRPMRATTHVLYQQLGYYSWSFHSKSTAAVQKASVLHDSRTVFTKAMCTPASWPLTQHHIRSDPSNHCSNRVRKIRSDQITPFDYMTVLDGVLPPTSNSCVVPARRRQMLIV
jgi:hypothetical protein